MKCPYRKIITHEEKYCNMPAKDIEEFAECYKEECPFYYKGEGFRGIEIETCDRTRKAVEE